MIETDITRIPVKDLHFDRENPRLAEFGVTASSTDPEILKILWDAMDVRELVQSIAANGFFSHEPVIVMAEGGRNVVIEGNRRLAAVKVLLHEEVVEQTGWPVPKLSSRDRRKLETLPAITSDRKDSWRYLGFKHVNGPAKWSSYAKANYIAEVHRKYRVPLADIANQIGDRHRTVQRLFRGLMIIEQAERERVYDRDDRFRQRFAFSHLYTGMDYDGIRSFIALKPEDDETKSPVPTKKMKELGELCVWLYGSKKNKQLPLVESQNPHLRQLDSVLRHREAVAALRGGTDLARAFEISRPSTSVFEEALLAAKRGLTTARAHLTTGYDNSDDLLGIAGSIAEMAEDICIEMERKRDPTKRNKRSRGK